jgi:hypothetical protein
MGGARNRWRRVGGAAVGERLSARMDASWAVVRAQPDARYGRPCIRRIIRALQTTYAVPRPGSQASVAGAWTQSHKPRRRRQNDQKGRVP